MGILRMLIWRDSRLDVSMCSLSLWVTIAIAKSWGPRSSPAGATRIGSGRPVACCNAGTPAADRQCPQYTLCTAASALKLILAGLVHDDSRLAHLCTARSPKSINLCRCMTHTAVSVQRTLHTFKAEALAD